MGGGGGGNVGRNFNINDCGDFSETIWFTVKGVINMNKGKDQQVRVGNFEHKGPGVNIGDWVTSCSHVRLESGN